MWMGQHTPRKGEYKLVFVPIKTKDDQVLMPMHAARARKLVKRGEATPYYNNGLYCLRLNKAPSDRETQDIAVGVDPGSQKEGFTVKSEKHTYLNVQADAHNKVGKKLKNRRELRRSRRSRKCPNRTNRVNRLANKQRIPAGTRARWDWKLRILEWLSHLYPLTHICVEDIKARTLHRAQKWNQSFSPLEVGKEWFYSKIREKWELFTLQGFETKELRDRLGLKKSSHKMSESFDAHCVDSWCLAYQTIGGDARVDNTSVFCISRLPIERRSLHRQLPQKDGKRPRYGGTRCLGFAKGTLVKHVKHGVAAVCGYMNNYLCLQPVEGGKRLTRSAKISDCKVLKKLNFRYTPVSKPVSI